MCHRDNLPFSDLVIHRASFWVIPRNCVLIDLGSLWRFVDCQRLTQFCDNIRNWMLNYKRAIDL